MCVLLSCMTDLSGLKIENKKKQKIDYLDV